MEATYAIYVNIRILSSVVFSLNPQYHIGMNFVDVKTATSVLRNILLPSKGTHSTSLIRIEHVIERHSVSIGRSAGPVSPRCQQTVSVLLTTV